MISLVNCPEKVLIDNTEIISIKTKNYIIFQFSLLPKKKILCYQNKKKLLLIIK